MIYKLLPPSDERVLSSIAEFDIERFKEEEKIELKKFVDNMFETMKQYGGIGLSANQVGKPYRMFVMGDHLNIEKGKKWVCINPKITNNIPIHPPIEIVSLNIIIPINGTKMAERASQYTSAFPIVVYLYVCSRKYVHNPYNIHVATGNILVGIHWK